VVLDKVGIPPQTFGSKPCCGAAERVYRDDLREFRNNGWALFGLGQSLRAQGKSGEAEKVEHSFQIAWKNADVTLRRSVF